MRASNHDEVLADHQVKESRSTGVIKVVVLEVVPKTSLDHVEIFDEVFEDVLNINQPFSKLHRDGGLLPSSVCALTLWSCA